MLSATLCADFAQAEFYASEYKFYCFPTIVGSWIYCKLISTFVWSNLL